MSCNEILHKRGDTWHKQCTFLDDDDQPFPLAGYQINSEIRTLTGTLIDTFVVTITNSPNGEFRLGPQPTDDWPINTLQCDIEYTVGGVIFSTETFFINVQQDITL
jgi:hypothetical protein